MATVEKLLIGTEAPVISAVAITTTQNAVSAAFNNTVGATGDGYTIGRIKTIQSWGGTPAANTAFYGWYLKSSDGGSTFEDGAAGTGFTPLRFPDFSFPADPTALSGSSISRTMSRDVLLPAGVFKVLVQNPTAIGQSLTSLTLTITPITRESV